jgi:hypothetical protein
MFSYVRYTLYVLNNFFFCSQGCRPAGSYTRAHFGLNFEGTHSFDGSVAGG